MILQDIAHLAEFNAVRFKEEIVDDNKFIIVSYMISDPNLWKAKFGLECRGHVFNAAGKCVSMPFEKFFNYCENEFTQPTAIGNIPIRNIFEKKDGTLITPVLVNDKIVWKTKKTFYNAISKKINALKCFEKEKDLSKELLMQDCTPIWEYTDPEYVIVIKYNDTPNLTLLAIRNNITGIYLPWEQVEKFAKKFDVELVSKSENSFTTLHKLNKGIQNVKYYEGYVVELENGMRVKLKTPWYMQMHATTTNVSERDIAMMYMSETLDDLKITISSLDLSLDPIDDIEQRVVSEINHIMTNTQNLYLKMKEEPTKKDMARKYGNEQFFHLAIILIDGNDPDYMKFWRKNYYKNYSLVSVYNINFSK